MNGPQGEQQQILSFNTKLRWKRLPANRRQPDSRPCGKPEIHYPPRSFQAAENSCRKSEQEGWGGDFLATSLPLHSQMRQTAYRSIYLPSIQSRMKSEISIVSIVASLTIITLTVANYWFQ